MHNLPSFVARRQRLLAQMPHDSLAIIRTNDEMHRNGDSDFPFRPRSDFYYLTGFTEPQAVAVLISGRAEGEFILFNAPRDPEFEIWQGKRAGQQGAVQDFGADQAFAIEELDQRMLSLLENRQRIYYQTSTDHYLHNKVIEWTQQLQARVRRGIIAPDEFFDLNTLLHDMRLYKDEDEIHIMQRAADISVLAHQQAMATMQPGMYEYELEATIIHSFIRQGAHQPAYTNIVASGENACCLHYTQNDRQIQDGDLVLIDMGAEYNYYAADITRTFPANGKFSTEQKAIYEAVLRVQLAVIERVRPGVPYMALQTLACELITQELIVLGLLQGDVQALIDQGAYKAFYMHFIGHWLGLDVHDAGNYRQQEGQWRSLQAGMVMTIEPGIYIAADNQQVEAKWRGIGVRIEDNVLVTEGGHRVLTQALPKSVQDIEALIGTVR